MKELIISAGMGIENKMHGSSSLTTLEALEAKLSTPQFLSPVRIKSSFV